MTGKLLLNDYKQLVSKLRGQQEYISSEIQATRKRGIRLKKIIRDLDEAKVVAQTVAQQTQAQLEYCISELVTLALEAVFDEPYKLKLEFVLKRGRTEAVIEFERDGETLDPMTASGGGAVDVASFALRIALWSLSQPRSRNSILLDEPFRFLSRELQPKAGAMLKMLAERLGLQFIVVTHNQALIESADRVFVTTIDKGVSNVNRQEGGSNNSSEDGVKQITRKGSDGTGKKARPVASRRKSIPGKRS